MLAWTGLAGIATWTGCRRPVPENGRFLRAWGGPGIVAGTFQKPRAMAIDGDDRLYIVDMTARIQVFDAAGEFLRSWRTPAYENGKPSGLTFDTQGRLMVADTHYFRVLFYTPEGELLADRTIGGSAGRGPGEFNFVTDAVQDSHGNFYVSEYGEFDRIQRFTPDGKFQSQIGSHGSEPEQFIRPQNLAIDERDRLWVVDACNHRVQVFDTSGEEMRLERIWGEQGTGRGQISYPYDLVLDERGHIYLCEFGNSRVQKFTLDGESLGCWGVPGRREGQLARPWALVQDSRRRLHVLDTYNHRVQVIEL